MSVMVRSVVWCVVLCMLINDTNGVRPRKRKANDNAISDEAMRKNRVLDDWLALSRPALDLVVQDLQLNPRGTTRELAERVFHHYHPQQQDDSPSQVQEQEGSGSGQNQLADTVQVSTFSTQFNELREELYSVLATQVADITHTLTQQINGINNVNTAESSQPLQIPINSAPQISPLQNQLPSQSPDVTTQLAALQQQQQQVHNNINNVNNHHTIANLFRMPVLSSQNLNL